MIKQFGLNIVIVFALLNSPAFSQDSSSESASDEKTRVGTCNDAKSQMEYFCEEKESNSNDMMLGFNACANAKKNVKEACEGIVEPDVEYKFEKDKE